MAIDGNIRVLLAEDDHVHQQLLQRALTHGRPQVNVTMVNDGEGFLQAAKEGRFDCAVLDYNLPDYLADELLSAARENLGDCPTVVISASQDQRVVISSIRCGGMDFVSKDEAVSGDELWHRVEHAVETHRNSQRDRRRTERRQRQLVGLVQRDALTGLFNRRYVERCLKHDWWRNERRRGMACVMVDIDHFKKINDTWGHAAGDDVLRSVAGAIRRHVSATGGGAAVRWGGEEMLLIGSSPTIVDSWLDAEALRAAIEQLRVNTGGQELHVTVSIGLAQCEPAEFCHGIIDQADQALYLAKRMGRNSVCTVDMARIAHAMDMTVRDGPEDVEERRLQLLRRIQPLQGPAQIQHTTQHCEKVSRAAEHLARLVRLDDDEVGRIRIAGEFHDIGKCAIPDTLLAQTETLTARQWWLMSRHTLYSQWIGEALGADPRTLCYLREHHRRYDDRRTTGALAPVGARILCLADALVTMVTNQVYRPARDFDAALGNSAVSADGSLTPSLSRWPKAWRPPSFCWRPDAALHLSLPGDTHDPKQGIKSAHRTAGPSLRQAGGLAQSGIPLQTPQRLDE